MAEGSGNFNVQVVEKRHLSTPLRPAARRALDCKAVAARNGRADWVALAEPRAPVPSEAGGLAGGPMHQFFNNLLSNQFRA